MKGEYISIETLRIWQEVEKENEELRQENIKIKKEKDKLLKTQKMYEKMCNKINDYIVQNCEIIRHKDYDEIGKVNGGHILYLFRIKNENLNQN